MIEHVPTRPSWRCTGCHAEWPCPATRDHLQARYAGRPVTLTLHLSSLFGQAVEDRPEESVRALYRRFLGWIG